MSFRFSPFPCRSRVGRRVALPQSVSFRSMSPALTPPPPGRARVRGTADDGHVPVCFDHTVHSINLFVVHNRRGTFTKFDTEIDTTALEFCKPAINSHLAWYFIAKSNSKPSEALLSC
ncbi:hypothetical protein EVAR_88747_1 [Eumeta japonica]|uniref:Uncharacterized protein n=1 Tax=Eumeta variegata TaxID=151549 RepID=A0A4C1XTN4_EUMVA|nr:hypothetical protein EVAR_88747_1 [Eumeta japonica]